MKNISFDLETLGNNVNSPIVQIGACKFDIEGKIGDKFNRNIKLKSLELYPNLKIDYETLGWWLNQKDKAIKSVFGENLIRDPLRKCLFEFKEWIGKTGDFIYWSHATFDPPILMNNFREVGLGSPIPFRNFKDIRTLDHLTDVDEIERKGIHHNALDDAIFQSKYISKELKQIKG